MPKTLRLVIPGLLGPWPNRDEIDFAKLKARGLERLLSRAAVSSAGFSGAEATLFNLFQVPVDESREPPVAAVTRLVDAGEGDGGWWLRADPVHLRADLHQVLLFDARYLDVKLTEAQILAAEFNRTFGDDGWILEALHPCRWYLRLESDPGVRTHPLAETIGRDINTLLPSGATRSLWHVLLTELQMLFYGADVNLERESRGQLPINSVWFWGGGTLPEGARAPSEGIYSCDTLVQGLARLAGMAVSPLPETAADWQQAAGAEADSLVVLESTRYDAVDNDPYRWVEHVNDLESDWLARCLEMLAKKKRDVLYLYPCNGYVYRLTRNDLRHFWRRVRVLSDFL